MVRNDVLYYQKEHDKLMTEWKERHRKEGKRAFISDGIVDPQIWFSQSQRVLYILKEAYDDNNVLSLDSDLTEDLRKPESSKGRIWSAIAEWQYGIENTNSFEIPQFDGWLGVEEKNIECYRKRKCSLLKRVAVINVKKSNGKKSSDEEDLRAYIEKDSKLLAKQISIINPTLIVCGSTFHLLRDYSDNEENVNVFGVDIRHIRENKGCFGVGERTVLAYYHPANQYPAALNFYGLVGMYYHYLK